MGITKKERAIRKFTNELVTKYCKVLHIKEPEITYSKSAFIKSVTSRSRHTFTEVSTAVIQSLKQKKPTIITRGSSAHYANSIVLYLNNINSLADLHYVTMHELCHLKYPYMNHGILFELYIKWWLGVYKTIRFFKL